MYILFVQACDIDGTFSTDVPMLFFYFLFLDQSEILIF
jgi:hypothetical protein